MVKDHSDSERGNQLPPHGLLFPISISTPGFFYMHHPTDRIAHTTAFVTPVVEHWLERELTQRVHHEGSIRWPIVPWANALTTELHLAPAYHRDDPVLLTIAYHTHDLIWWISQRPLNIAYHPNDPLLSYSASHRDDLILPRSLTDAIWSYDLL